MLFFQVIPAMNSDKRYSGKELPFVSKWLPTDLNDCGINSTISLPVTDFNCLGIKYWLPIPIFNSRNLFSELIMGLPLPTLFFGIDYDDHYRYRSRLYFSEKIRIISLQTFFLGARLRGRTATQRSKKGSEKVLGRVLGKGSQKGSEQGACYGFYSTVGTKIIADPEKCFQELINSEKLLILLGDRSCLELIIISSKFQALLFLQKNYWNQSESY